MEVKVRMIIMSHVSDMQATGKCDYNVANFIKWLLMKYPDTSTEVNADDCFREFQASVIQRAEL